MSKKKCINCGSSELITYTLIKCDKCGHVIEDFFEGFKKEWNLKITYENNEILIRGNKTGLEFLASCCLSVIRKTDPSGHIHLQWQMNNLDKGSIETVVEFSEDAADYV